MALVEAVATNAIDDGSGADVTIVPGQVSNQVDDFLILFGTFSLNNSGQVNTTTIATPAGWNLLFVRRDAELKSYVFWKRSTGSESFPNLTISQAARWSSVAVRVEDVDWSLGGIGDSSQVSAGGDTTAGSITTNANGEASVVVSLFSHERRPFIGFSYPVTRPQVQFLAGSVTGTAEGIDNGSVAAFDFLTDRNFNYTGPRFDVNGSGDSMAFNIEVLVNGNDVPLQLSTLIQQSAPSNSYITNMDWVRLLMDGSLTIFDGNGPQVWTFNNATDITPGSPNVTITGHGMDESMIVRIQQGPGTVPGGLVDDNFYFVTPVDANTVQFVEVNEDSDGSNDLYVNGAVKKSPVTITSVGSGFIGVIECRILNSSTAALDIFRGQNGNSSNVGPAPGSYIGDNGYNQNHFCTVQQFSSPFDTTGETIQFGLDINGQNRIEEVIFFAIDSSGNWMAWTLYTSVVGPNDFGEERTFQIQPAAPSIQALSSQSGGSFDATDVIYFGIGAKGNNTSVSRYANVISATGAYFLSGTVTLINGLGATWSDLVALTAPITDALSQPSDLQIVSVLPIQLGDGINPVGFIDSEKSIAFPPLADGVTQFSNYLESLGVTINVSAPDSFVAIQNTQIGASVPYDFTVIDDSGGSSEVVLLGNSYVFANAVLDPDGIYDRQVFVGGRGVQDNGAALANSTFIVNEQLPADQGMITYGPGTNITNSTFQLTDAGMAHAILITTPGTYTFDRLAFQGFGADESSIAAVYNNSGGAVTINVSGGDTPTVRNGTGATTNVVSGATLTIQGVPAGGILTIFDNDDLPDDFQDLGSTLLEVNLTTGSDINFSHDKAGDQIAIQFIATGFEEVNEYFTLASTNQSFNISSFITQETNL